jgi:ribosomal protein S1
VLDVDLERRRVSLSMKSSRPGPNVVSKGEERKREERRQEKRQKQKSTFTNNPFAAALGDKNQ